ncbi:hypothetical protein CINF_1262 [Candidatus Campylobacter infans]|uniref:Uncharacterized protein n=1 Tax=Candidatus Campylobacter infans TaxID=2561898 RepID=A0A7H9CKM7_9BACT|nr:hypothetical protein [Candidatus Campylobacter infans]QLI05748.1 hypothetical protein CINF_1262 [Candidatus Campylobacter infans]
MYPKEIEKMMYFKELKKEIDALELAIIQYFSASASEQAQDLKMLLASFKEKLKIYYLKKDKQ